MGTRQKSKEYMKKEGAIRLDNRPIPGRSLPWPPIDDSHYGPRTLELLREAERAVAKARIRGELQVQEKERMKKKK